MAKCDRAFLVPYLKDVCTLELMKKKLNGDQYSTESQISKIERICIPKVPTPPVENNDWVWENILWIIALVVMLPLLMVPGGWFMLIGIVPCAGVVLLSYSESNSAFEQKTREYTADVSKRNEAIEYRDMQRKRLPALQTKLSMQKKELQTVNALLQQAYSANIIPGQYRNLYAVVFLYDFFSNGRSDDIDFALSLYVLEQIKERLDTIIVQLSQVLINQSIAISNQERGLEQQQDYQKKMEQRIAQLQATEEDQQMYLEMIACHTQVSAYFAAENYFNRK